ncbi:thiamine diphosphokinase [Oryzifoliimicrobium ureilyticus]|uniref:thiamine diphosphokinase n=1 Tax=Oryzifoliimicrobium ureilyticus TaxID=3113724 RepID=UPI0030760362
MSLSAFTILLGGELEPTERVRAAVAETRVIAADGGIRHAGSLGLVPELWVGDFDSSSEDLQAAFPDVPRMPYPAAKGETDGEIAIGAAIARGARRLILAGALGGERSDHALQHLAYAVKLAEDGYEVLVTTGQEEAVPLVEGAIELDLPPTSLFSVVAFGALEKLSIDNARYPLAMFNLPFGSSRTISNVAEGKVRLTLKHGRAIVIARPYDLSGV